MWGFRVEGFRGLGYGHSPVCEDPKPVCEERGGGLETDRSAVDA